MPYFGLNGTRWKLQTYSEPFPVNVACTDIERMSPSRMPSTYELKSSAPAASATPALSFQEATMRNLKFMYSGTEILLPDGLTSSFPSHSTVAPLNSSEATIRSIWIRSHSDTTRQRMVSAPQTSCMRSTVSST